MSRKWYALFLIYLFLPLALHASDAAQPQSKGGLASACEIAKQTHAQSPTVSSSDACEPADKTLNTTDKSPEVSQISPASAQKTELENVKTQAGNEPGQTENSEQGKALTAEQLAAKEEEQRLKVLFVDVNTVMENVGHTMDWTANWIDGYFATTKQGRNKAKAWGHIIMGWEPRDGEWLNFPVKFKVQAKLPNLKNKVELILSDNEQDDFKNLPYESVRPEAYKSSQRSLGAAVRFLHASSENVRTSSRLGWGDDQVYARTQLTYRKKYLADKVTFNLQPAIEYYVVDGWGGRVLVDTGFELNENHELRYNYSIRDLETYEFPEWRTGLYSISAVSDKSAVIVGASAVGIVEPEHKPEFYKFSVRYRKKAIRSWIFIEVEPFVEFSRERTFNEFEVFNGYTPFVRDIGITFRLEAHYGFL